MNLKYYILLGLIFYSLGVNGQIVSISQPYKLSQLLNPGLVGDGIYKQRIQSGLKSEFLDGNNLYNTVVIGWDRKFQKEDQVLPNYFGIGTQIISDRLMNGILQNNSFSFNTSYHIFLNKSTNSDIGIGLGAIYSQSFVNKSNILFEDQYYDNGVPKGNGTAENLKDFPSNFSISTGVVYKRHSNASYLRMGGSLFFFDKPQNTVEALYESTGLRKFAFMNFENELFYDFTYLFYASINQLNNSRKYEAGAAIGYYITKDENEVKRIYFGCNYRRNDAIVPNFSFLMENYSLGFSYDINSTPVAGSNVKQQKFELNFSRSFGNKQQNKFRSLFD
jgi:hypothetical protein